jgi:hypothetical protein
MYRAVALLLAASALSGCQLSLGSGGLDYDKLEGAITTELNNNYAAISRHVAGVDCPHQAQDPKAGDALICNADLEGQTVRVRATVSDENYNVKFDTLDAVYDLSAAGGRLSQGISEEYGFDVAVTCGDSLRVVEIGRSFECTATDPTGDTRTVRVTAAAVGEDDQWEVLGQD